MKLIQRIISSFKEYGPSSGLVYIFHRALQRMSKNAGLYYYDWTIQPVTNKRIIPERIASKYAYRKIEKGDKALQEIPVPSGVLDFRYEQDSECIALFKDDKLAAYIWLTYGSYDEDEIRATFHLDPPHQAVFDYNLYIIPDFRMGMAFAAIWDYVNRYLFDKGIRYTYSRITHTKINSAGAHKLLGARFIGKSITLKLWNFQLMYTTQTPKLSVLFDSNKRVRINLTPEDRHDRDLT